MLKEITIRNIHTKEVRTLKPEFDEDGIGRITMPNGNWTLEGTPVELPENIILEKDGRNA